MISEEEMNFQMPRAYSWSRPFILFLRKWSTGTDAFNYLLHFNLQPFPLAMNSLIPILNDTVLYEVTSFTMNSSGYGRSTSPQPAWSLGDTLSFIWSMITIWRILVLLLVAGNLKNIPLIWHVRVVQILSPKKHSFWHRHQIRIINAFRFCCRSQRPKVPVTSAHLFQPLITTSHAPIMEIDFNLHS